MMILSFELNKFVIYSKKKKITDRPWDITPQGQTYSVRETLFIPIKEIYTTMAN